MKKYNFKSYSLHPFEESLTDFTIDSIEIDGITHGVYTLGNLSVKRHHLAEDDKTLIKKTNDELIELFKREMQYLKKIIGEFPFKDIILISFKEFKAEDYEQYVLVPLFKPDNIEQIVSEALAEYRKDLGL